MTGPRESFLSKLGLAVIAPVLVVLLVGGSSPWWLQVIFPPSSPGPSAPSHSTSQTTPGQTTPRPTPGASMTIESLGPLGDCVVTIKNPFVDLHEDPDPFSQAIIQVPPGDYGVSATATGDFAGGQQRWLEITAEGRTGWIEDNTINIDAKSVGCD